MVEDGKPYRDAARAAVPEIGTRWSRWYDVAYRLLQWSRTPPRAKALTQRGRLRISRWINILYRYHELERNRAWSRYDPTHNLAVPSDERVDVPSLWVVELFPPSAATELASIVDKFNPSANLFEHRDSIAILAESRAGQGYDWLHLASIKDPASDRLVPEAHIQKLPDRFWGIDLTEIQLGDGLTAVIARFHFTDEAMSLLDREWHAQHEPRLRKHGDNLIADDRMWSAFSGTQRVRRQSHDLARAWMRGNCPGIFAQSAEPQPLLDLLILEKFNPTDGQRADRQENDRFRALGLSANRFEITSPHVPEFGLAPTQLSLCPTMRTSRSWALWGNRVAAVKARPGLSMYNGEPDTAEALAHAADDEIRNFLLALSITELVKIMQADYAAVRDTARRQHDSFSSHDLQSLRRQLLTLSNNLASLEVDVPLWWERNSPYTPCFFYKFADGDDDQFDFTEHLRTQQSESLTRLSKADRTIRDILATVAALGSARDTRKVSRAALVVAFLGLAVAVVTLAVAVLTLFIASPGEGSIACHEWHALCGLAARD